MLNSLMEKISPSHTALLVVDVQNDFASQDGMMCREGLCLDQIHDMVPRLRGFIAKARKAGVPIIFIKNIYNTEPNWYLSDAWLEQAQRKRNGSYITVRACEPDSFGGDFFQDIRPEAQDAVVIKHRFDAFQDTALDAILRARRIKTLIMTGITTNICVESTSRTAANKDYYVVFTEDCTGCYNPIELENTHTNIDTHFGCVVQSGEIAYIWENGQGGE